MGRTSESISTGNANGSTGVGDEIDKQNPLSDLKNSSNFLLGKISFGFSNSHKIRSDFLSLVFFLLTFEILICDFQLFSVCLSFFEDNISLTLTFKLFDKLKASPRDILSSGNEEVFTKRTSFLS